MKLFRRFCWAIALLMTVGTASAHAQKLQWSDVVYARGRWQAGRLVAPKAPDTLALVMKVDYFAAPPKWRAEIRRTTDGINFADPVVLFGEKQKTLVATALGTTPLEQHALGKDSVVRAAVVFDAAGQRVGPANGAINSNSFVVFRRSLRAATFADASLNPGNQAASRQLLSKGLVSVGNQRSAAVVATAGARGVDNVKTPKGEVAVRPDSMAVVRMERFNIGAVSLEDFLREGGLGAYKGGNK